MTDDIIDLTSRRCMPCEKGTPPLPGNEAQALLAALPGWEMGDKEIFRKFDFKNYCQTMAFVNAAAWVSHREDHHPDMTVGYNKCRVEYSTHAIGGLSENDFICAAKVDALLKI